MAALNYGFQVGDLVSHLKDASLLGIVTELDATHDIGGVTTCRVAWGAESMEAAHVIPREAQDIPWTNKLTRANCTAQAMGAMDAHR